MGSDFSCVRDQRRLRWERAQPSPAQHGPLGFPRVQTQRNQNSEEQTAPSCPAHGPETQHDLQETQNNLSQCKRSQSFPLRVQPGEGWMSHTSLQVSRTVAV